MIDRRALLAAAALLPAAARARESVQFQRHPLITGPALLPRHVDVWTPEGFDDRPLLLMHDGQNLFEPVSAYGGTTWQVAETISRLVAAGAMPPVMVEGVWNTAQRWRDYVPSALLEALPAAMAARFRKGNGGGSLSESYVSLLADTIVPMLRNRHRVAPGRVFIMGSSMGGLASLDAIIIRPDVFTAAGCLSITGRCLHPSPPRPLP